MDTLAIKKMALETRKKIELKWLTDHDYIINKIVLGEWLETDPRFIAYKEERLHVREKLDQIEAALAQIEAK